MTVDTSTSRKQFLIRSENMTADDFGELYTRMFGSLYSGMPRPKSPSPSAASMAATKA